MSTILEFGLAVALLARGFEPIGLHPDNPRWFLWRGEAVALITGAEHYGAVLSKTSTTFATWTHSSATG